MKVSFFVSSGWPPLCWQLAAVRGDDPVHVKSPFTSTHRKQGVLPSKVAKFPAQISNLEVHQPQGRHDAWPEGGSLPLSFHCYATKVSCPAQSANASPGWLPTQGVLPSEVAKFPGLIYMILTGLCSIIQITLQEKELGKISRENQIYLVLSSCFVLKQQFLCDTSMKFDLHY